MFSSALVSLFVCTITQKTTQQAAHGARKKPVISMVIQIMLR